MRPTRGDDPVMVDEQQGRRTVYLGCPLVLAASAMSSAPSIGASPHYYAAQCAAPTNQSLRFHTRPLPLSHGNPRCCHSRAPVTFFLDSPSSSPSPSPSPVSLSHHTSLDLPPPPTPCLPTPLSADAVALLPQNWVPFLPLSRSLSISRLDPPRRLPTLHCTTVPVPPPYPKLVQSLNSPHLPSVHSVIPLPLLPDSSPVSSACTTSTATVQQPDSTATASPSPTRTSTRPHLFPAARPITSHP